MCCCHWSRERITESSQRTLLNDHFSPKQVCPAAQGRMAPLSLCMHLKPFLSGRHLEAVHAFLILKRQCNTETIEHTPFFFFSALNLLNASNQQSSFVTNSECRCKTLVCTCSLSFVCAEQQLPTPDVTQKQNTNLPVERRGRKEGELLSQGPFSLDLSPAIVCRTASVAAPAEGGSDIE